MWWRTLTSRPPPPPSARWDPAMRSAERVRGGRDAGRGLSPRPPGKPNFNPSGGPMFRCPWRQPISTKHGRRNALRSVRRPGGSAGDTRYGATAMRPERSGGRYAVRADRRYEAYQVVPTDVVRRSRGRPGRWWREGGGPNHNLWGSHDLASPRAEIIRGASGVETILPRLVVSYERHLGAVTPATDGPLARALRLVLADEVEDWHAGEELVQCPVMGAENIAGVHAFQQRLETAVASSAGCPEMRPGRLRSAIPRSSASIRVCSAPPRPLWWTNFCSIVPSGSFLDSLSGVSSGLVAFPAGILER